MNRWEVGKLEFEKPASVEAKSKSFFKSTSRRNDSKRSVGLGMCEQNPCRLALMRLMIHAVCDVEALVICIVIIPMLFLCSVVWLQMVASPLGAIVFYCVYLPLSVVVAMIDYARKKRSC